MQESDWKVFRRMIPELRERYLHRQNEALVAVLTAHGKTETERFWSAEERVKKEARVLHDCLDDHRRSRLFETLMLMRRYGMLSDERIQGVRSRIMISESP
jgi:hypothetical protein